MICCSRLRLTPVRLVTLLRTGAVSAKTAIMTAFKNAPTADKAAYDKLSDGKDKEFVPVTHKTTPRLSR